MLIGACNVPIMFLSRQFPIWTAMFFNVKCRCKRKGFFSTLCRMHLHHVYVAHVHAGVPGDEPTGGEWPRRDGFVEL